MTRIDGERVGDGAPGPLTMRVREAYWALHDDPAYARAVADISTPAGH